MERWIKACAPGWTSSLSAHAQPQRFPAFRRIRKHRQDQCYRHANTAVIATERCHPAGTGEGSTPNALAISADGGRCSSPKPTIMQSVCSIFISIAGVPAQPETTRCAEGFLWLVSVSCCRRRLDLLVINGKGRGTAPNPRRAQPGHPMPAHSRDYTLGQISGTLAIIPAARASASELDAFSQRVVAANGWNVANRDGKYPPFEHVIYIVKENRTYDQVLGDLPQADGDTSIVFFPRPVSPNHHALAERFGIFDRFFVNAEVSADGHNWSMAAYATDYTQKTTPQNYSGRGRSYDYQGTNRGKIPDDDVAEPSSGYLWNLAERAGITYRHYGEFVDEQGEANARRYIPTKQALAAHSNTEYPGFDTEITDQVRADVSEYFQTS